MSTNSISLIIPGCSLACGWAILNLDRLDRYQYTNDAGYLADGTPISQAGNNSLHAAPPSYMQAPAPPPPPPAPAPAPAPVAPPPPVVTAPPVVGSYTLTSQEALHGVSFSYSMQKDAYADLEFLNDVGYVAVGWGQGFGRCCCSLTDLLKSCCEYACICICEARTSSWNHVTL